MNHYTSIARATNSRPLLQQARDTAEKISYPKAKASALADVVSAMAEMSERTDDITFLQQARDLIERIPYTVDKAMAVAATCQTAAKLGYWRQALQDAGRNATDAGKALGMISILSVWSGQQYIGTEEEGRRARELLDPGSL